MNKFFHGLSVIAVLATPLVLAAQSEERDCNQLGREIALRAAEEMRLPLDGPARARLAAIAERACIDFGLDIAGAAPGAATAAEADDADSNTLFDLEVIEPEDRVRRPGLKRR